MIFGWKMTTQMRGGVGWLLRKGVPSLRMIIWGNLSLRFYLGLGSWLVDRTMMRFVLVVVIDRWFVIFILISFWLNIFLFAEFIVLSFEERDFTFDSFG